MGVKIGGSIKRGKGYLMPVTINGTTINVPLKRKRKGKVCREYSFSQSPDSSAKRVKQLKKQGHTAFSKKHSKGNKSIYVVYKCSK